MPPEELNLDAAAPQAQNIHIGTIHNKLDATLCVLMVDA